jgi:hypothetical protein
MQFKSKVGFISRTVDWLRVPQELQDRVCWQL